MKKLTDRITLPVKLTVVGVLPLLLLIFLAVTVMRQQDEKLLLIEQTMQRADRTAAVVQVVDQMQLERRESFVHAVTKENEARMIAQRAASNEAIAKLKSYKSTGFEDLEQYTFLNKLQASRDLIDGRKMLPMEVMSYYTNSIFRLNTLSYITVGNIPYLMPANDRIISQRLLSEMATYLGILRASVYDLLYTRTAGRASPEQFRGLYDIYVTYVNEYEQRVSAKGNEELKQLLATADYQNMNGFLQQAFQTGRFDTTQDAEKWWAVSGKAVDDIKKVQRNHLAEARTTLENIHEHEVNSRDRNLILLIIMTALVLFTIAITIRSITSLLNKIRQAATRIAVGETDIKLNIPHKDVIGSLAESINEIDTNNRILSQAAAAIGSGNFDIDVSPRSEADLLGNAVASMKTDLARFNSENRKKIWLQAGESQVNDAIRGDQTVEAVSEKSLQALAAYLKAEVGMIYVSGGKEELRYCSGFAIANNSAIRTQLHFGETLVGQAAANQQLSV
ncbi:MAG: HAMP domain-containing protein, partial [Sphingobacteriales bacterium]